MVTKHSTYGTVTVLGDINDTSPMVLVRLHNPRDNMPAEITVGKVALENTGEYKPKVRTKSMVERHLPICYSAASRMYQEYTDWDELLSVATVGLLEAAERWDQKRNTTFGTFARPYVIGYLKNFLNPERNGMMNNLSNAASFEIDEDRRVDDSLSPDELVDHITLRGMVAELKPNQRLILRLVYEEGHNLSQVAKLLDRHHSTVYETHSRAIYSLRKAWNKLHT